MLIQISFARIEVLASMLFRSLLPCQGSSFRRFSSAAPCLLKIGDTLTQMRTFTSEDVMEYAKISRDSNPVHFDSEAARNAGFEDRVVHGMLVASIFPWIISSHFPGAVYVTQNLQFKSPVYSGDEIVGEVEAIHLRRNHNRHLAKFRTRCFKNGELLVIDGEAMAILPSLNVAQV